MFKPKPDEKLRPLTINLSPTEIKTIEELADKYGCKRPTLIRQILQNFIDQQQERAS